MHKSRVLFGSWIRSPGIGSKLLPLGASDFHNFHLEIQKKKRIQSAPTSPGGQSLQIESLAKVSKIGGSVDKIVLEVLEDPLLADPWAFHPDC